MKEEIPFPIEFVCVFKIYELLQKNFCNKLYFWHICEVVSAEAAANRPSGPSWTDFHNKTITLNGPAPNVAILQCPIALANLFYSVATRLFIDFLMAPC